jgi:hypothetical protein
MKYYNNQKLDCIKNYQTTYTSGYTSGCDSYYKGKTYIVNIFGRNIEEKTVIWYKIIHPDGQKAELLLREEVLDEYFRPSRYEKLKRILK